MRNRVILFLVGLVFLLGLYEVLYLMYGMIEPEDLGIGDETTNVEYASYVYLASAAVMSLLTLFLKDVTVIAKRVLTFMVSIFYVFSWILALITFYANPNNRVEVFAGAIFFLAGSVFLASTFFVKVKESRDETKELGTFHKVVRYFLVSILGLYVLNTVVKIVNLPNIY